MVELHPLISQYVHAYRWSWEAFKYLSELIIHIRGFVLNLSEVHPNGTKIKWLSDLYLIKNKYHLLTDASDVQQDLGV